MGLNLSRSCQVEGFVVDLEGFEFRLLRNSSTSRLALISVWILDSSGEAEGILECLDDLFALVVS